MICGQFKSVSTEEIMRNSTPVPPQDRVIVRVPQTLIAKIDDEAARQHAEWPHHTVTRSHVIRQALAEFLRVRAA